jgi:hypothetical protein
MAPLRWGVNWDAFGWRAFALGIFIDTEVVRSGDDGIERGTDIDVFLGWWSILIRVYRVRTPYLTNEHVIDALLRDQGGMSQ